MFFQIHTKIINVVTHVPDDSALSRTLLNAQLWLNHLSRLAHSMIQHCPGQRLSLAQLPVTTGAQLDSTLSRTALSFDSALRAQLYSVLHCTSIKNVLPENLVTLYL